jgi:formylglycine-generating enzyme required for sulfatase activity
MGAADSTGVGSVKTIFQGSLKDMPMVGLLQSLELGSKSAAVHIRAQGRDGTVYVRGGQPVDAWFGQATGEEALLRMLDTRKGTFRVEFGDSHSIPDSISSPLTMLLLEGARRSDHRVLLEPKLPPHKVHLESVGTDVDTFDPVALELLATCNGTVTRDDLIDASVDALAAYETLARLWEEGSIRAVEPDTDDDAISRSNPVFPSSVTAQLRALQEKAELSSPEVPVVKAASVWWKSKAAIAAAVTGVGLLAAGVAFVLPGGDELAVDEAGLAEPVQQASVVPESPPPVPCPQGMVGVHGKDGQSSFCIDATEVTVAQYESCVERGTCARARGTSTWPQGQTGAWDWDREQRIYSKLCNARRNGRDDHPVNCVSWEQANAYCGWLGRTLPSEQQWELAARGAEGRTYPWGNDPVAATTGNFCGPECRQWRQSRGLSPGAVISDQDDGHAETAPVGSFLEGATRSGIYDLAGNVAEWTSTSVEGEGGAPDYVMRGGAFDSADAKLALATTRVLMPGDVHPHSAGFRCVATPAE